MNSTELGLLKGEILTIKKRIEKSDRRITANKVIPLNVESETDRKNRLSNILTKKEERLRLALSGEEV